MKKFATFIGLLLMSISLMQFVWRVSGPDKTVNNFSAEKINLALRRTAHLLLKEAGDSTSCIPPVERSGDAVWLVRLQHPFNYDRLPDLLQSSLDLQGISCKYDVSVLNCRDETLVLGYNYLDFSEKKQVPCTGRVLPPDCYNIRLGIIKSREKRENQPLAAWFFTTVLVIAFYWLIRKYFPVSVKNAPPIQPETEWLTLGQSRFDATNQVLVCNKISHRLSNREAKLLLLFIHHPNQALNRDFILDKVWADEGIMVGRSVDMFVSRLRKMLRDDPSVQLVAVYSVGYRLEIA